VRLAIFLLLIACAHAAYAWDPFGHDLIDATAFRRLMATPEGRETLRYLSARGILRRPHCFEADCAGELPVRTWPPLETSGLDLLLSRQLGSTGQCYHFMAHIADVRTPIDPALGIPHGMVIARDRCIRVVERVLDRLLVAPAQATRAEGAYAILHAIADSYSPAHAERDATGRVLWLRAWRVPEIWRLDRRRYHRILDKRDRAYWVPHRIVGGRRCRDYPHAYVVPEACLTPAGAAAVQAEVDLLILLHRAYTETRSPSLTDPAVAAMWSDFRARWVPGADAPVAPEDVPALAAPKEITHDVFAGARVSAAPGVGLAASVLLPARTWPLVPLATGAIGAAVSRGATLSAELALVVPLFGGVAVGFTPLAGELGCQTSGCRADLALVPLRVVTSFRGHWFVDVSAPAYSWLDRSWDLRRTSITVGRTWDVNLSLEHPVATGQPWDPRPFDETGGRPLPTTHLYLAASVAGANTLGGGVQIRWDRDRWSRRAGFGPQVAFEILASPSVARVTLAPGIRWFFVKRILSADLVPAALSVLAWKSSTGFDVTGQLGLSLVVGVLEFNLRTPALSYVGHHVAPPMLSLGMLW
jgi:hypothetical protein